MDQSNGRSGHEQGWANKGQLSNYRVEKSWENSDLTRASVSIQRDTIQLSFLGSSFDIYKSCEIHKPDTVIFSLERVLSDSSRAGPKAVAKVNNRTNATGMGRQRATLSLVQLVSHTFTESQGIIRPSARKQGPRVATERCLSLLPGRGSRCAGISGGKWAQGSVGDLEWEWPTQSRGSRETARNHWQRGRNVRNARISKQKVDEGNGDNSVVSLWKERKEPQTLKNHSFLLTGEQGGRTQAVMGAGGQTTEVACLSPAPSECYLGVTGAKGEWWARRSWEAKQGKPERLQTSCIGQRFLEMGRAL